MCVLQHQTFTFHNHSQYCCKGFEYYAGIHGEGQSSLLQQPLWSSSHRHLSYQFRYSYRFFLYIPLLCVYDGPSFLEFLETFIQMTF